jgi:hypothetical protein
VGGRVTAGLLRTIVASAAAVAALGVLWRSVVRPARTIARIYVGVEEALPILREVVEQVRNDHGSSLRDHIERTEERIEALETYVHEQSHRTLNHLAVLRGERETALVLVGLARELLDAVGRTTATTTGADGP